MKLGRVIDWAVAQFGPIQFAISQDRQGRWRLGLVKGTLRNIGPAYNHIQDAKSAYYMVTKEVKDGVRRDDTSTTI